MKLLSMIPLEFTLDSQPIILNEKEKESEIDKTYDYFKNTISNFTRNIDSIISVDSEEKKEYVIDYSTNNTPNQFNYHESTPYKPATQIKKHVNPEIGRYTPQYEAILPHSPEYTLKKKDENTVHISSRDFKNFKRNRKVKREGKQIPAYTMGDVISIYNNKIREIEFEDIKTPNLTDIDPNEKFTIDFG